MVGFILLAELEVSTRKAIAKEEERLQQKRRDLAALQADIRSHEHRLISKAQSQREEQLSKQRCDRVAEMQQKLESKVSKFSPGNRFPFQIHHQLDRLHCPSLVHHPGSTFHHSRKITTAWV